MANSKHISEDEIKYIVDVESAKAQQEIRKLEKSTASLRSENKRRLDNMIKLENDTRPKNLKTQISNLKPQLGISPTQIGIFPLTFSIKLPIFVVRNKKRKKGQSYVSDIVIIHHQSRFGIVPLPSI